MKRKDEIDSLKKRYVRLAARLSQADFMLQGTITERFIEREKDGQRSVIGPYYQWTYKQSGKTVTVNLSASQAKRFQKAIDTNKMVEETLKELRHLSREILEATTEGVVRRKPQ